MFIWCVENSGVRHSSGWKSRQRAFQMRSSRHRNPVLWSRQFGIEKRRPSQCRLRLLSISDSGKSLYRRRISIFQRWRIGRKRCRANGNGNEAGIRIGNGAWQNRPASHAGKGTRRWRVWRVRKVRCGCVQRRRKHRRLAATETGKW